MRELIREGDPHGKSLDNQDSIVLILTTKEGKLMVPQSLLFSALLKCYYFSVCYPNKKKICMNSVPVQHLQVQNPNKLLRKGQMLTGLQSRLLTLNPFSAINHDWV